MTSHEMFGGKVQLYRRGKIWWRSARIGGKRFRESTGHEKLDLAEHVTEEWYLDMRGKLRNGEIVPDERTFRTAALEYMAEMRVLTIGVRSPKYVEYLELRMNRYILPYFGSMGLSKITKGVSQSYLVKRVEETIAKTGKPPARSTLLQEIVHVRQVLKFAEGQGWLPYVPSLSSELLKKTKTSRRAWFSHAEYETLYKATRRRISEGKRPGYKSHYEDQHDYVLFMANTGLRPDEAANLELRDINVTYDPENRETILDIDVRGKTGVGFCRSTTNAVYPYHQLRKRREAEIHKENPGATPKQLEELLAQTKLFRRFKRAMFNAVLDEEGLKFDRDGQRRTAYSLRHTYICMRLLEGADIRTVANNCRTSVEMIEEHYAAHIRHLISPKLLNARRSSTARKRQKRPEGSGAEL